MTLKYATLTRTFVGGFFGRNAYLLDYLNDEEKINLNEFDKISEGKIFETFDEGVAFLGGIGYNLCSVIPCVHQTEVHKGWFSKNF